ncbi:Siderophore iron transporter 3 [Pseudocercospora fuligena]|uniref:Siderophore iron transporter 3 n=1 Tax=Pseudocercospora fuligena TaxID=685502 RepID=A0A8H6RQG1_9PEZI|nr:Siderophore iron transporter 3 [Pseudocercospora fuligena]
MEVLFLAGHGVQDGFNFLVSDQDLILSNIQHQETISQYGDDRKGPNRRRRWTLSVTPLPRRESLFHSSDADQEAHRNASVSEDPAFAGVTKVEAFNKVLRKSGSGKTLIWTLFISIGLTMFAYSIDQGTTSLFNAYAASAFGAHAKLLTAVSTAGQIVRAISKPFLGKLADITSRPTTYTVVLVFYAVGFAVAASANSLAAYTVGTFFTSLGKSGLDFLGDVIVADLTNLRWRGFFGSLLSVPFIVTSFIDGFISEGFLPEKWRWGLGMFAIMTPILLIPAIITLYAMEHKAKKLGMVSAGASRWERAGKVEKMTMKSYFQLAWQGIIDIDLAGLLLLGFAFGLILLSLSLYKGADGGFSNPSMIAMIVVGFVTLIAFILYEMYVAPKPVCSSRIFNNKAFIAAVGIDVSSQLASGVHSLYYASYVLVVEEWTIYETNLFTNMLTILLCILGPLGGLYLAKTHRFKTLMLIGAVMRLIGYCMQLEGDRSSKSTAILVVSQIFCGFAAFTVLGARVGSQASVPHEDLASIIAQLSLWSTLASSVGYAISGAIWQNYMLPFMRDECPAGTTEKTLLSLYGSIKKLRDYAYDSPIRQCGIVAYQRTNGILFIMSAAIAILPVLFCFLMPNYYLGKQHNVATNTTPAGDVVTDERANVQRHETPPSGLWAKLKHFWLKEY